MHENHETHNKLADVHEDMNVVDSNGNEVGRVEYVHYGSSSENVATADLDVNARRTFFRNLGPVYQPVLEMPDEVQERLHRFGFVFVDGNLLHGDRFISAEDIAVVTDNTVQLRRPYNQTGI